MVTTRASAWPGRWAAIRDAEVVCAVIAERKTTGAARRLGLSQPAVSRAVAAIEQRLGHPLFLREGGRLVPTAEALRYYERSLGLLAAIDARETVASNRERASLAVGAPPTLGHLFLQSEVALFAARHPATMISFDVMTIQSLPSAVAERQIDIGMVDADVSHAGVVLETYCRTEAVCLMRPDNALAARDVVRPADLDGADYVGIKRRHSLRGTLDRVFVEAGVAPRVVIETDTALAAAAFVRAGLGVSVLNPFPLMPCEADGLVARPFSPALPFRASFVLPADRPPEPGARALMDFLLARRADGTAERADR